MNSYVGWHAPFVSHALLQGSQVQRVASQLAHAVPLLLARATHLCLCARKQGVQELPGCVGAGTSDGADLVRVAAAKDHHLNEVLRAITLMSDGGDGTSKALAGITQAATATNGSAAASQGVVLTSPMLGGLFWAACAGSRRKPGGGGWAEVAVSCLRAVEWLRRQGVSVPPEVRLALARELIRGSSTELGGGQPPFSLALRLLHGMGGS